MKYQKRLVILFLTTIISVNAQEFNFGCVIIDGINNCEEVFYPSYEELLDNLPDSFYHCYNGDYVNDYYRIETRVFSDCSTQTKTYKVQKKGEQYLNAEAYASTDIDHNNDGDKIDRLLKTTCYLRAGSGSSWSDWKNNGYRYTLYPYSGDRTLALYTSYNVEFTGTTIVAYSNPSIHIYADIKGSYGSIGSYYYRYYYEYNGEWVHQPLSDASVLNAPIAERYSRLDRPSVASGYSSKFVNTRLQVERKSDNEVLAVKDFIIDWRQ